MNSEEVKKCILREGIDSGTGTVIQTDLIWESDGDLYVTGYYSMSAILDSFEVLKHEKNNTKNYSLDELKKLLVSHNIEDFLNNHI